MSEKASKGYDPTQARMVGNMLAGEFAQSYPLETRIELCIEASNKVIKKLRKQFKEESE
jgi:hypothetical protein